MTQEDFEQLRGDIHEIKSSLQGNKLGNRGIIKRLEELEFEVSGIKFRITQIFAAAIVLSAVAGSLSGIIFELIRKIL